MLHQDICYRTQPLVEGTSTGTQIVSLDQRLAIVGIASGLLIATWVEHAESPFDVQVHPLEHGGSRFVGLGDFVGDRLQRLIVADNSRFEVAYALDDRTPTGVPVITTPRSGVMPWIPLGPIDLSDGSSVLVAQDGWGQVGTFRLDMQSTGWATVAPTVDGPPQVLDAVVFDANQDGLRDLVLWGTADDPQVYVLISDGAGGVVPQSLATPCVFGDAGSIYVGDLTGDGAADLACSAGDKVQLLANDGDGAFENAITVQTVPPGRFFLGVADLTGYGTNNDLLFTEFMANEYSFGFLPAPFTDAKFVQLGFPAYHTGGVADFDNDGLDEVVIRLAGGIHVIIPTRLQPRMRPNLRS